MNNCDNWYEMTEQALSTINKLMPTEVADPCIEIFPAIQQSTIPAASSKPTACSSISMSPNTSSHVSLSTLQDNKNHLLESRRPYSDDCDNETQTNDDIRSNGAPCADSISQKLKNISPPDQFPVEKDAVERQVSVGRGVTLAMLLADSLVKAGTDVLSFEHSGEQFVADLLADGKIRWNKEDRIFHCTSSWIVYCKKTSFPHEKLTCSITEQVKYKGKSLDHYKLAWSKKHRPFVNNVDSHADDDLKMAEYHQQDITRMNAQMEDDEPELNWILSCSSSMINYQESIPHAKLGRRSFQGIPNLFVECSSFTKMNRVQPFKLNITKNCLLLLHFHCHLLGSEVLGYLAGKWDSTAQQLIVSQAYPCKCSLTATKDETDRVEYDIMTNMDKSNLILVGWYHSHVGCPADPSLRDVEMQMEYQFQLKGYESATFQPCVGLVISPFHMQSPAQLTSDMKIFYVYPPSEQRPLDYGMPLEVEHTISKDDYVTDRIISEMEKLIKFYSNDPDYLPKKFKKSNLPVYLNRLKNCLSPFCPSGYLSESIVKVFENF